MKIRKEKIKQLIILHITILLYSVAAIILKCASKYELLSLKFIICYGIVLFILFIYAIFWQQILKKMPLTLAYSNKSVTIVWGMIWGSIIFKEKITINMIIGACIVILGVFWMVKNNE